MKNHVTSIANQYGEHLINKIISEFHSGNEIYALIHDGNALLFLQNYLKINPTKFQRYFTDNWQDYYINGINQGYFSALSPAVNIAKYVTKLPRRPDRDNLIEKIKRKIGYINEEKPYEYGDYLVYYNGKSIDRMDIKFIDGGFFGWKIETHNINSYIIITENLIKKLREILYSNTHQMEMISNHIARNSEHYSIIDFYKSIIDNGDTRIRFINEIILCVSLYDRKTLASDGSLIYYYFYKKLIHSITSSN